MKRTSLIPYSILFLFACFDRREHTRPIVSDITISLYASAYVKAKEQHTILSSVSGFIKHVGVEPGEVVQKGTILFVLEDKEARLNAANARQLLDYSSFKSSKNSEQLKEALFQVEASKDRYEIDSSFYQRQKRLWDQNIGTRLELDQRQLAYSTSRINYDAAVNRQGQLAKQLLNEAEVSKINYRITQSRQSDYLIKSDMDGRIFDIIKHKGELVNQQNALCVIGSANEFYLEMNVDEKDITKVKTGQRVEITMDSYQGRIFSGKVSKIYPIMEERSRTFKIEAVFLNVPPRLYPNLTAEVNIIVDVRRNAILIPRSYLDEENFVLLQDNKKRKVATGVKDERNVEVLNGLDTLDVIYKPK